MDALKRRRGGHRACVTKTMLAISIELSNDSPSIETLQGQLQELERQKILY